MPTVGIAAIALNQTPLDWEGNRSRILKAAVAAAEHAQVLCCPELCVSGYGCEDLFLSPWVRAQAWESLELIIADKALAATGAVLLVGLPVEHGEHVYNGAAVIQGGQLLGITAKQYLATSGVYYESRWFAPWKSGVQTSISSPSGKSIPFGDVWYDFGGVSLGVEICEDAWVEDRPAKELAERGVRIICNLSASHFGFSRRPLRERIIAAGSRDYAPVYCYANLLGCESGRLIFDGDRIIAHNGQIIASGERFLLGDFHITTANCEIQSAGSAGVGFFNARKFPPIRGKELRQISSIQFTGKSEAAWESSRGEDLQFHEFARAVSLGMHDYLRKSGSQKFALSLSGGADSAACAVLVDLIAHRRSIELNEHTNARELLVMAYQGTAQSSASTLKSAQSVAEEIDVGLHHWDVQPLVDAYQKLIEQSEQRSLSWNTDDLTLQNIQSRVRAPSIWLLANMHAALLLTTANRSEAAVGYATMDGDTSGGLAPLGGVDKHFIRRWLHWIEANGVPGIRQPYKGIAPVNELAPSAELRPGGQQTDEDDLMPYEVLVAIERAAVRYRRGPVEALKEVMHELGERYATPQLSTWTDRFFTLFFRSQWKRERYAPAFHIDDFSLDPKTWLRMPILSGTQKKNT